MIKSTITLDTGDATQLLDGIQQRGGDLMPLFKNIGEYMQGATEERFKTSTAPDGSQWVKNKPSTMANYLGARTGKSRSKKAASKRPLIGMGGFLGGLAGQINYQVSAQAVQIGSPKIYAAVMHYGAKKGEFGTTKNGVPLPWGDIPARNWLGASDADEQEILILGTEHLGVDG